MNQKTPREMKTKAKYYNVPINIEHGKLDDLKITLRWLNLLEIFEKLYGDIYPLVVERSLLYAKQYNRQLWNPQK